MGPFFKFVLAESWGCPGTLRMPSGFKAWQLFSHGLQTKKGPLSEPFFKVLLAESWGFEPQMPFWGILA